MKRVSKTKLSGFTLVEVLVALAIVGIGMAAVFGQLGQAAATANYLRLQTFANWVAVDRVTEVRLLPEPPAEGDTSDEIELGGLTWRYRLSISDTEVPNVRRIDIEVALDDAPDNILATGTGFMNAVPVASEDGSRVNWAPRITEGEQQ
jgi:general secretion pathway protein I